MRKRVSVLSIALLWIAASAMAQQHPNVERGLMPDKSYQVGDVDAVNLFNGAVNIALPIGQKYSAGGNLSYQFSLSNASNSWEVADKQELSYYNNEPIAIHYQYTIPERGQNAGFGWLFTFGAIGYYSRDGGLSYLSPDGGRHRFYDTLHINSPSEASSGVRYTRDGTYLRLIDLGTTFELDFPDGDKHIFEKVGTAPLIGGRLKTMSDAFGNTVTINYGTRSGDFAGSAKWTVTDSTGREHYVYFRPSPEYMDSESSVSEPNQVVDYFDLAAFNGTRAEYHLEYLTDGTPGAPSVLLPRRCTYREPPEVELNQPVRVPVLGAVQLPIGRYEMQYDLATGAACSSMSVGDVGTASGNLTRLKLPTGAAIEYRYGVYTYPGSTAIVPDPVDGPLYTIYYTFVPGVKGRIVRDRNGQTILSETEYVPEQVSYFSQRRIVRRKSAGVVLSEERNYFMTRDSADYGLPYTRDGMPANGPFLSTEIVTPGATRSTYVIYDADDGLSGGMDRTDVNRRPRYQKTLYEDGKFADATYTDFDGYGHYRSSAFSDNIEGSTVNRSSYTNFTPLITSQKWLLTTFDVQRSTENSVTSSSRACFDPANGFLTGRRTYAAFGDSPSRQAGDLLTILHPDGHGNVDLEQFLGGDTEQAPDGTAGTPAPVNSDCLTSSATDTFRIGHLYSNGMPSTTFAVNANGQPMSFFVFDVDVDLNTGLPRSKRDASTPNSGGDSAGDGLKTDFTYDALGRLTLETPQGTNRGARRRFVYAADLSTIEVFEENASNTQLRKRTLTLDGMGRITRETRSMPNGLSAFREWQFDGLGRMTTVSSWGNGSAPVTRFQYDVFGRPTLQTNPDGTTVTLTYSGVSSSTTTAKVHTAADTESSATTTYTYDGQGRIRTVTEPNGIVTRYTYDIGGHLSQVCADVASNCAQNRGFTYDNRGFLIAEQTPELGVSGNGTASYRYDARGNMIRRTIGDVEGDFDVWMRYDRAGRIENVYEAKTTGGVHRNLTNMQYGTSNIAPDYRNGRLTKSTSYNWFSNDNFAWQIVEAYAYEGRDGRLSKQSTNDFECNGTPATCNPLGVGQVKRSFEISASYDELGATITTDQPKCLHTGCVGSIPDRTVTNTYDNGFLQSVTWTGAANPSTMTYHLSGIPSSVAHGNQVTDYTVLDSTNRLYAIATLNAVDAASCTAPSFQSQPQSTTVPSSNTSVTLSASAVGDSGLQVTYQWYTGVTGDHNSPINGATSGQLNVSPSGTTQYWIEARTSASGACPARTTASQTATVTVCTQPSITTHPQGANITRSQSATLQVIANGGATLTYRWFTVAGQTATEIQGANASTLQVTPQSTTSYRVVVSNGCGSDVTSNTVAVNVADPPTVPAAVAVTTNGTQNNVSWSASLSSVGILRYEVRRYDLATPFSVNGSGSLIFIDGPAGLTIGTGYRYQVRAVDSNGAASDWSAPDYTVTLAFDDPSMQALVTPIRGTSISQLRQAVDGLRACLGLTRVWSSYAAVTGPIHAVYVTELRDRLNEARAAMDLPPLQYTNPIVAVSGFPRAIDIQELRLGVN
jgi:YD repeat-containing protein